MVATLVRRVVVLTGRLLRSQGVIVVACNRAALQHGVGYGSHWWSLFCCTVSKLRNIGLDIDAEGITNARYRVKDHERARKLLLRLPYGKSQAGDKFRPVAAGRMAPDITTEGRIAAMIVNVHAS